jgi:hypothetical protein
MCEVEVLERTIEARQLGFDVFTRCSGNDALSLVQFDLVGASPAFFGATAPRVVDQMAPHVRCHRAKELLAIIDWRRLAPGQPQPRLVEECRGLQRMIRSLTPDVPAGHPAQIVVDLSEQL